MFVKHSPQKYYFKKIFILELKLTRPNSYNKFGFVIM